MEAPYVLLEESKRLSRASAYKPYAYIFLKFNIG